MLEATQVGKKTDCPLPFAIVRYRCGLNDMLLKFLRKPWTSSLKISHKMLRVVSYFFDKTIRFGQNSAHFDAREFAPLISCKIKNRTISSNDL